MALPFSEADQDDHLEILDEVKLVEFRADPANIGPFGASLLRWRVEGPPGGFTVELNSLAVQRVGEKVVQPAATTSFALSARAASARRPLGRLTVAVDTTGCESFEPLVNPKGTLRAVLKNEIQTREPDLKFRSNPVVSFSPGRISFSLRLSQPINSFPNPDVDIDASFGLGVVDGALAPVAEQVSAGVSVPWYAWLIPGAFPGLAIALDMAKDRARKGGHEAVEGLVQLIGALSVLTVPEGKRIRTARVDAGNNGAGIIEVTACPFDLLRQFAAISEVGPILQ